MFAYFYWVNSLAVRDFLLERPRIDYRQKYDWVLALSIFISTVLIFLKEIMEWVIDNGQHKDRSKFAEYIGNVTVHIIFHFLKIVQNSVVVTFYGDALFRVWKTTKKLDKERKTTLVLLVHLAFMIIYLVGIFVEMICLIKVWENGTEPLWTLFVSFVIEDISESVNYLFMLYVVH